MNKKSKPQQEEPADPQGFTFRGQQFTSAITVLFRMATMLNLTDEEVAYAVKIADLCPADDGVLIDTIIENNVDVPQEETE